MQGIGDPGRALLAYSSSLIGLEFLHLALDAVELAEELQRPLTDLAAMVDPQLVELPAGMGKAANLRHAQLEAGVVAAEVVAQELAVPTASLCWVAGVRVQAQEAAHMLPAAALGEVEHHRLERVIGRGAVVDRSKFVTVVRLNLSLRH